MASSGSKTVVFTSSLVDAQRAWSALMGHGITAWLQGSHFGNLYWPIFCQVAVSAENTDNARAVLIASGLVIERPET